MAIDQHFEGTGYEYLMQVDGVKVMEHGYTGTDLEEKADMVGIPQEKIIKTFYFDGGLEGSEGTIIPSEASLAIVLPSTAKFDRKKVADLLGIYKRRAQSMGFAPKDKFPKYQSPGTFGPMITKDDVGKVEKIIFQEGMSGVSDFAMPGKSHVSIHAPCEGLYEVLRREFPDKYMMGDISK